MTAEEQIAYLWSLYRPEGSDRPAHVVVRIRTGARLHVGYLTSAGSREFDAQRHPESYLHVRDSSRAPRSQYAIVTRHNVGTVQVDGAERALPIDLPGGGRSMTTTIMVEHLQRGQPRPYAPHTYEARITVLGDRLLEGQIKDVVRGAVHHFVEEDGDTSMAGHFRTRGRAGASMTTIRERWRTVVRAAR